MPTPRPAPVTTTAPVLQFRARVLYRGEIAFGPGKAELLTAIQRHGSIAQAAKTLGMSYMRAWTLVKIMNRAFRQPLVVVDRGGAKGGEARLTPLGREVLALYGEMIRESRAATRPQWARLRGKLKRA